MTAPQSPAVFLVSYPPIHGMVPGFDF